MNLSVCMIVKNEEDNIKACLDSIPCEIEVIIVDTGSRDRTIQIISEYSNVRLFRYKWNNDFAEARNFSLKHASGSHIMVLDADERFQEGTYQTIVKHIKENPRIPIAIKIHNIDDDSEIYSIHRMIRLFPNSERYGFLGSVHESLHQNGAPVPFIMGDITIDHYGYNRSSYREQKFERYYELYHKHLEIKPSDGYMWYQLGKLYASVDEYEQACDAFIKAMNYMLRPSLSHAAMIIEFSKVLRKVKLVDDAINLLESERVNYHDYPDLWFQLGLLYMDAGEIDRIVHAFEEAIRIGDTEKYVTALGTGSYLSSYNMGVFYEVTGNFAQAVKYYQQAGVYSPAKERLLILQG